MMLISTILLSLILQIEIKAEQEQCYADNASPYSSFGGTMSYFSSRGSQLYAPKDCTPIFVWGIIRHGTRYPTSKGFIKKVMKSLPKLRDEIILNHKNGRGNLCEKDLENLKNWKASLTPDLIFELTPQGTKEMIFLAQKMKEAFPGLLKSQSKNLFMFQSSNTNRTRDSALAFTNELLGTNYPDILGNNITEDDEFLRLYKNCPNYGNLKKNPSLFQEINLFKTSALWQKITAEISLRLGFLQPLSNETIMLMYNICAYENAWYSNAKPPFCAAFASEDLKAMEYCSDMHLYHAAGYGNSYLIKNMGCPIVRDMMLTLSNAAKNNDSQKGKFLFSHSEAVIPALVKLGLYKDDEELKFEHYPKKAEKRKWRGSSIDNFASNIIATLYKCPGKSGSQNVVIINHNEHPMVIPQCSRDPCTLEELQGIFKDVFNEKQCNTNFCEVPESSNPSSGNSFFANSYIVVCILSIKFII